MIKKILLIEDDFDVRSGLIDLLEASGYKAISASSGKEGLTLANEVMPDLIICDIMMPGGLNGYDVLNEIEKDDKLRLIPFIFLTAKGEMSDLRRGMQNGAADYIVKPYDAGELLSAIRLRIEKADAYRDQSAKTASPQKTRSKRFNYNDSITLLENNNPVFIKFSEIICITAENIYSTVYTTDKRKLLIRKSLAKWENILPESGFLRIHRSTIININYIDKIEKWYKRSYKVLLKNHISSFIISQRYASKIKSSIPDD